MCRSQPRFDYARQSHRTKVDGTTARFESDILNLDLVSTWPLEADGNDVRARITVRAGELGVFVLESGAEGAPTTIGHGELIGLFDDTVQYWQQLGREGDLPGALAGGGVPLGHHPQADDLCPHGRPRGGTDRWPARTGRRRAELGLPLHLDP